MNIRDSARARRRERGYALLTVVFLAAAMLIAASVATPVLLTQGKREKEDELIWRGEQYARAIRLYYRKHGRFPQSLEDLSKPKNEIRFLRKPYTEPMNQQDGSWRLIYIGPAGQLIGSVKRQSILNFPGVTPPAPQAQPGAPAPVPQAQTGGPAPAPPQDTQQAPAGVPPAPPASPAPAAPQQPSPTPQPAGPEGPVFGGSIIGVASKINRSSIRVYDGSSNYREWEFIWDPTKDAVVAGQPAQPAQPAGTPTLGDSPPQPPARPRQ